MKEITALHVIATAFCSVALVPAASAADLSVGPDESVALSADETYDNVAVEGALAVTSGKIVVPSGGSVSVGGAAGGPAASIAVTGGSFGLPASGATTTSAIGANWRLGASGGATALSASNGGAIYARTLAIDPNHPAGDDGGFDFLALDGGTFCAAMVSNRTEAVARIAVSGSSVLQIPGASSNSRLLRTGAFAIALADGATLTVRSYNGQYNNYFCADNSTVEITGTGNVRFTANVSASSRNNYVGNHVAFRHSGALSFGRNGNDGYSRWTLPNSADAIGSGVTAINVASETYLVCPAQIDPAPDVAAASGQLLGSGSFAYRPAAGATNSFAAGLGGTDLSLVAAGEGTTLVSAAGTLASLSVEDGATCVVSGTDLAARELSLPEGATLVVDGVALAVTSLAKFGGTVECLNGGALALDAPAGDECDVLPAPFAPSVAILKTGGGRAVLFAPSGAVGSVHVAAGALGFSRWGVTNHFYRFTFKELANSTAALSMRRIAFAKETGEYEGNASSTGGRFSDAAAGTAASALKGGQAAVAEASDIGAASTYNKVYGLFAGAVNGDYYPRFTRTGLDRTAPETWQVVNWRVLYGNATYPWSPYVGATFGYGSGAYAVTAWTVETSPSGEDGTWTVASDRHGYTRQTKPSSGYYWQNYGSGTAFPTSPAFYLASPGAAALPAFAAQIDAGALLDATFVDGGQPVNAIAIDLAAGAGTASNLVAAANGTLRLANAAATGTDLSQPLPLVLADFGGAGNLDSWTVEIDGAAKATRRVRIENGRLLLVPEAFVLYVR